MAKWNRRHKAAVLLAVVATGLSLLLEASAKQTAGVLVLGMAAAWLIGSLSPRTLGIVGCLLVSALGLFVAVLPVKEEWDTYQRTSQEYDFAIFKLREAIAKAVIWDKDPTQKTVGIPESAQAWEHGPHDAPNPWKAIALTFPRNESDEQILRHFQTKILRPRPSFSLMATARTYQKPVLLGLSFAAAGFVGSGWFIRAALRAKRERTRT